MENTKEYVASLKILAGQQTAMVDCVPTQGEIVGVVAYFTPLGFNPVNSQNVNNGFVRASIKNDAGEFISRLQSIHNYTRRDGGSYISSAKPLKIQGGGKLYIDVIATSAFNSDFIAEFIFIYKDKELAFC